MAEPFRPWTWKIPEGGAGGKRGLIRGDGYARASGKAAFTRDIYLPGMLYAKIHTSPYACAKIVSRRRSPDQTSYGQIRKGTAYYYNDEASAVRDDAFNF